MRDFFQHKRLTQTLTGIFLLLILITPNILLADTESDAAGFLTGVVTGTINASQPTPGVPITNNAQQAKDTCIHIFGKCIGVSLDHLAIMILRGFVNRLGDYTVNFINNGFQNQGESAGFAVDLEKMLIDSADVQVGNVLGSSGFAALCSPFQNQIKLALVASRAAARQRNSADFPGYCRLSQVSKNINGLLNGDFVNGGGWSAWFTMTQDPMGNPYTSFLTTQATIDSRIASAAGLKQSQLTWSQGFLSTQDCTEYVTNSLVSQGSGAETKQTLAPGQKVPDGAKCITYGPVKTPGSVVESELTKVFGSKVDQLNVASNFNQIVTALANQLENYVFNSAKGIFANKASNNGTFTENSDNTTTNGSGSVDCMASSDTYIIGFDKPIQWTLVGAFIPGAIFSWGGDEITASTTQTPIIAYQTEGTKGLSVTVSQRSPGATATSTITQSCSNQVTVSKYQPLRLAACQALDPLTGKTVSRVQPGAIVKWIVTIAGGSGKLNKIDFNEGETLNITKDNFKAGVGNSPAFGQYNAMPPMITPPAILPLITLDYAALFPFFQMGQNTGPTVWFARNPNSPTPWLPLTPDSSGNYTLTIPILYTQIGTWHMSFDNIYDNDVNVTNSGSVSCKQSINVDSAN